MAQTVEQRLNAAFKAAMESITVKDAQHPVWMTLRVDGGAAKILTTAAARLNLTPDELLTRIIQEYASFRYFDCYFRIDEKTLGEIASQKHMIITYRKEVRLIDEDKGA